MDRIPSGFPLGAGYSGNSATGEKQSGRPASYFGELWLADRLVMLLNKLLQHLKAGVELGTQFKAKLLIPGIPKQQPQREG